MAEQITLVAGPGFEPAGVGRLKRSGIELRGELHYTVDRQFYAEIDVT
jgi:hypothetical protein